MNIDREVRIKAPIQNVFAWLESPEKAKQWMASVTDTRIIHQTDNMVGTTFLETVTDGSGKTTLEGEVLTCVPPSEISFRLSGKHNDVHVSYSLKEENDQTLLRFQAEVSFKTFMARSLGNMFKSKVLDQLMKELTSLKKLCESPHTTGNHS